MSIAGSRTQPKQTVNVQTLWQCLKAQPFENTGPA